MLLPLLERLQASQSQSQCTYPVRKRHCPSLDTVPPLSLARCPTRVFPLTIRPPRDLTTVPPQTIPLNAIPNSNILFTAL
ncbi:hypothetical protein NMY22_g13879 [Coprinellus aureogranulatus]|nr:hypothetical protein NMY22_g13879 [Coprinellus aureogranulatus]